MSNHMLHVNNTIVTTKSQKITPGVLIGIIIPGIIRRIIRIIIGKGFGPGQSLTGIRSHQLRSNRVRYRAYA